MKKKNLDCISRLWRASSVAFTRRIRLGVVQPKACKILRCPQKRSNSHKHALGVSVTDKLQLFELCNARASQIRKHEKAMARHCNRPISHTHRTTAKKEELQTKKEDAQDERASIDKGITATHKRTHTSIPNLRLMPYPSSSSH